MKDLLIHAFIKFYGVNMEEAEHASPAAYPTFNQFFTRRLRPHARSIADDPDAVVAPADGVISQIGEITAGALLQAKGRTFSVLDLLGGKRQYAEPFFDGKFMTIYLSPRDYHRVHMPVSGRLTAMIHIPGRLFSVNAATTTFVPQLFTRNERVIALFETEAGPLALVLVGALLVASIDTVWHGVVTPPSRKKVRYWSYEKTDRRHVFERGEFIGCFNMGSTVIALFAKDDINWSDRLQADERIRMGEACGRILRHTASAAGPVGPEKPVRRDSF